MEALSRHASVRVVCAPGTRLLQLQPPQAVADLLLEYQRG
jgi:hypothetical protein